MNTHPNSKSEHPSQPNQPEVQPEVAELAPIPAGLETLAKVPLPTDPLVHLSPWARRLAEQNQQITNAKEHAHYEMAVIPELQKVLKEIPNVDIANTIDYLSEHPHTVNKLTSEVSHSLIEHFPGFLMAIICHLEVSAEDAEEVLQGMIKQLGARRTLLLFKSRDKNLRDHIKNLIVDMSKRSMNVLSKNPKDLQARAMLDSSTEMLVAGVIDNLLHFDQVEKVDIKDHAKATNLVLSDEYQHWTKHVLNQYPEKEILGIAKSAMKHFPKEKFEDKILERISREKKESIFSKIAPEMSAEELTKVLIRREIETVRQEILHRLGKKVPEKTGKVFPKPREK